MQKLSRPPENCTIQFYPDYNQNMDKALKKAQKRTG